MLWTMFLVAVLVTVSCLIVLLCTSLLLGRGLTFQIMLRMMLTIGLLAQIVATWMLFGGPHSWKATLIFPPVGIGMVIVSFVLLGRGLGSRLEGWAGELRSGSEQIDAAAEQVASSSQSLAQGASEQASSLESVAEASGELVGEVREGEAAAGEAAAMATQSAERVASSSGALEGMQRAMESIGTANEQIRKVLKMIDEIAFQTNILALNAAVEAARAGESGAGFAVVAEEVRSLAQRCTQAANETGELVSQSITATAAGKETVAQVVEAVRGIALDSDSAGRQARSVQTISTRQAERVRQVSASIDEMEKVTQSNAASAEQNAAAAHQLRAQASAIRNVTDQLVKLVKG